MARLMRHVSMVVLLSTALANSQAMAKPPSKLSGKLQSFRAQVRKVLGNPKTMDSAFIAAGLGAVGLGAAGSGIDMFGLSEYTIVQTLLPFTGVSFVVLGHSIDANVKRLDTADAGEGVQ